MLKKIKRSWKAARGEVLREELEDCLLRLRAASEDVRARCGVAFASAYLQINQNYGPMPNISNDGKRVIAKEILNIAKKEFVFDMGRGQGLFLMSTYLEAQTLPGKDAGFVRLIIEDLLAEALTGDRGRMDREADNVAQHSKPPALSERPRDRLAAIAREYGLRIADEDDDVHLAAAVAAHVTQTVISRCGWEPKGLSEEQKFAAAIFSVVAADHCSRLAGTAFELTHTVTALELFRGLDPSAIGSLIREATDEYNRMLANPIDYHAIKGIGDNIAGWVKEEDEPALHKLSRLLKVIAEAPIGPRSTEQSEAKALADPDSKPPAPSEQPSVASPAAAGERKRVPARAAAFIFAFLAAETIAAFMLAAPGHEILAISQGASDYVRISPGDGGSAEISISPLGANRYHVTGLALWGEYRRHTHPVHTGELDFTAELNRDTLEHSEPYGDRVYRVVLRFSGDLLHVTEENWAGVHGMNVTFEGAYRRHSGGL